MILAKGSLSYDLAMIINYACNHSFIVLATVIVIVNYDGKTFIVRAAGQMLAHPSNISDCSILFREQALPSRR
jgi:hypothetical protein